MKQPKLFKLPPIESDKVYTPRHIARYIVDFFKPSGVCLDPCAGDGVFLECLPTGSEWCELDWDRDFFEWTTPVDWIITNPPYSIFSHWLRHSFNVAENIVYLIPINKAYNSYRMMCEIHQYGGIPTILVIGPGNDLCHFDLGFVVGAVHFKKGYSEGTHIVFAPSEITRTPGFRQTKMKPR